MDHPPSGGSRHDQPALSVAGYVAATDNAATYPATSVVALWQCAPNRPPVLCPFLPSFSEATLALRASTRQPLELRSLAGSSFTPDGLTNSFIWKIRYIPEVEEGIGHDHTDRPPMIQDPNRIHPCTTDTSSRTNDTSSSTNDTSSSTTDTSSSITDTSSSTTDTSSSTNDTSSSTTNTSSSTNDTSSSTTNTSSSTTDTSSSTTDTSSSTTDTSSSITDTSSSTSDTSNSTTDTSSSTTDTSSSISDTTISILISCILLI
nr:A-agglutinin anchorage subunit-like [Procambarus clarkii]